MVDQLTQEEIHNFREAFNYIDKDRDGAISHSDLSIVMKKLGQPVNDDVLKEEIKQADSSGSGNIFFPDFLVLISQHIKDKPNDEEDILDCLQALDENGTGLVKVEILREVLSNLMEHLTQEDLDNMLNQFEPDEEGCINYKDFVKKIMADGLFPSVKTE